MRADITALLVVVVSLTTGLTSIGAGARKVSPVSTRTTGGSFLYEVVPGDSLVSLGARHGIDPREIALANGLKLGGAIAPGLTLRLDNRHIVPIFEDEVVLVINVPQRMLFFTGSQPAMGFPAGLGRRDWPTPLGEFSVIAREENPTWDVPTSIQAEMRREGRTVVQKVSPGPTNPLGAFWLGLSLGSVGVHGTNAPLSIFRHVTHGCVRMHPDDIARLYPLVPLGARGRIVYEPVLLAQTPGGILLEAHPDVYRRMTRNALSLVRETATAAGIGSEIDWAEAANVLQARRGIATRVDCSGEDC
jgi:L,D-transpeptidase ErfK/SrfK